MKKMISTVLVTALLASIAMSGCSSTKVENTSGGSGENVKGEPTVTNDSVGYDDATVELTWLPQEGFDSTNKTMADYYKESAVNFVKEHPEVKIKITVQSSQINDAMAKLLTQAAAGNAPDLAAVDSFVLPHYYEYLQPVTDVLEENNIPIDSWFQFAQDMMKPEDDVLAMWYGTDVRALYYQKDLVETPPTTWDELFSIMEPLKEDGYTFLYPAGKNETTSCDVLPWFWAQGGELLDENGAPAFDQGQNKTAMLGLFDFLKKTIDTGITPTRVTSFITDGDVNEDVAAGKVAMFVGGSWITTQLCQILGEDTFNDTYGIANIPVISGADPSTCCGGWTCGVFSQDDTKRKLAAQFAIDTFISDKGNVDYNTLSGNLPCRETSYDLSDRFKNDPIAMKFKELFEYGEVRPAAPIYSFISTELQVAVADVINGNATSEKALETMAKNVNDEYSKTK